MSVPGGPIPCNLGKGSHVSPELCQWRQGYMVITKVCCLCPLEGQPLRPMLHWGSTRTSSGVLEECGTDYRDQSPTCEMAPYSWHKGPTGAGGPFFEPLCSPGPCTQGLWWEWQLCWSLNPLWGSFFIVLENSAWLLIRWLIHTNLLISHLTMPLVFSFFAIRIGWEFS